jgi:antirestriction protein ArdC
MSKRHPSALANMTTSKLDIYKTITNQIVCDLEAGGIRPWHRPWTPMANSGKSKFDFSKVGLPLRATGEPYQGINVLILWMSAARNHFTGRYWMTYNKAHELGGQVRKGEHGTKIIFFKTVVEEDEERQDAIPIARAYTVFNIDQIDGLPERFHAEASPLPEVVGAPQFEPDARFEEFFGEIGAKVVHGGMKAFYSPKTDTIRLPDRRSFIDVPSYYSTRAHESVHWTGHSKRLNRLVPTAFGSETYAFEELVAEIGAAFLCATLGLKPNMELSVSYISNWIDSLKHDKRMIFRAAAAAQKAVNFLHQLTAADIQQAA